MEFKKQIGKLFNLKEVSDASQESLGDEDNTAKNVSSAILEGQEDRVK